MESDKKYAFRVKIARELEADTIDKIKRALARYEVEDITTPKHLPVGSSQPEFEHLGPVDVYVMDIITNYPSTPAEIANCIHEVTATPLNNIIVRTPGQEIMNLDHSLVSTDGKPALDSEYPKNDHPQLLADLAEILKKHETKYKYEYAAPNKEKAKTTNDLPQGNTSPVGTHKNKLPQVRKK
jgi:hypothetical protein